MCNPLTVAALVALFTPQVLALYERTYQSSPLVIQPFTILERAADYDPDNTTLYLTCPAGNVVSQPGATIYDSNGELVWADPNLDCAGLNYQTYDGQQYLTMWIGSGNGAAGLQTGSGTAIMLNSKYEIVKNVSAINPGLTDLHEFHIVQPENRTALVTAYNPIQHDLTSVGGSANGWYLNSIIQEIDIASGRVLFNWTSIDHIALSESYNNISLTGEGTNSSFAWDAVHINSIDKDRDGNYLISARNCQTIYKLDKSGAIIWRLGGKMSNFTAQGNDTEFHWQHHARWRMDGTQISVFDDGAGILATTAIVDEPVASGKFLTLDQTAMTVSLAKQYLPAPHASFSLAEGSIEPYGNIVSVGYGSNPWVIVHDANSADVLFSAVIGPNNSSLWLGGISNYRVFQTSTRDFAGHPTQPPSVAISGRDVYVSWNGATHVASYSLLTGSSATAVTQEVVSVAKTGFETKMSAAGSSAFISVSAVAANGTVLGKSAVYKTSDGSIARR
ncbi:ASST-domain-containing protein [Mycena capillaripes]|nr:ASST-domain-containing protein [Mycena capillaripes]